MSVIIYRAALRAAITYRNREHKPKDGDLFLIKYNSIITASTAAALNLLFILILNQVYSRLAYYLTELEMPRTQTEFDNSLTLKMFLLQFVNYYSSIFYVAFFKGRFVGHPGEFKDQSFTQEECSSGGCLLELAIQLSIIMVGKQALNALVEMGSPWIKWAYRKYKLRKDNSIEAMTMPQWEDDFTLSPCK
jgi:anoctamin-1